MSVPENFNHHYYLLHYPDLRQAGLCTREDAINHYITHGCKEGRIYNRKIKNNMQTNSPNISFGNELSNTDKICVLLHIGYFQEWDFYRNYLLNIPFNYDLYVTIMDNLPNLEEVKQIFITFHTGAIVLAMANKGLDGGGFLIALNYILERQLHYDFVLKIHTKSTRNTGPHWRLELLDPILGSAEQIKECIRIFHTEQNVGMLGSKKWLFHEGQREDIFNFSLATGLVKYSGSPFIAGTMFWARFNIIADFFTGKNLPNMVDGFPLGFPPGESAGHFLERIFGFIIVNSGYTIKGI